MRRANVDEANLLTLEALIAAFLLIGAALFVSGHVQPTLGVMPQARLDSATQDAAVGLAAREDRLDALVSDAYRCAHAVAATTACREASARTTRAIESYLPIGAQFALSLSNGQGTRTLHGPDGIDGASSTASLLFTPTWNHTFATTDLSCHDLDAGLRVHALPLRAGTAPHLAELQVTSQDGTQYASTRQSDGWWSADVPAGAAAHVTSMTATGGSRGLAYAGHVEAGPCALGTLGGIIREGLASSTFSVEPQGGKSSVAPGGMIQVRYNLSPLLALAPSVQIQNVAIDIHAPVPPLGTAPAVLSHIDLGDSSSGATTWRPPTSSVFGLHPAVLRVVLGVPLDDGNTSVEVRLVTSLLVTLPHGQTAENPLYRISITAWWPE